MSVLESEENLVDELEQLCEQSGLYKSQEIKAQKQR
jgi:hypothetical protein